MTESAKPADILTLSLPARDVRMFRDEAQELHRATGVYCHDPECPCYMDGQANYALKGGRP